MTTATKSRTKQKSKADPLDTFAAAGPSEALSLVLWKSRIKNPELTVEITLDDISAYEDCIRYLKVTPQVRVYRPSGTAAMPAQAAVGTRPAYPARPAGPPKPFVVVQVVDQNGDAIRPVENNEAAFKDSSEAARARRIREQIPELITRAENDAAQGILTEGTVRDLCNALRVMTA